MKIFMVLMAMNIGGAETHVLELATELKRMGHEVLIASNGGVYTKELEENGIRHYKVPLLNKKPQNLIRSFFALNRIIKNEKPDIVHGHARIPSFILSKINKIRSFNFVTTAHWVFNTSGILKYVSNWGYRTIAVSEDIREYLKENYNLPDQDISVTINGINTDKFSPERKRGKIAKELGLREGKRRILYISRMDEDRSLVAHHLIEVAPKLREIEDTDIIIVGNGNDYDKVFAEADAANKAAGEKYIYMAGGRTDIADFVAEADFFVGVSRSALEAMSAALPVVIAGNEGYIGIFTKDNLELCAENNFCCRGMAEPSPELLFEDMKTLLTAEDETLKTLGDFSRETILTHYSVNKMAQDNLDMYNSIVNCGNNYKDAVISGYYGHKNSGDDALLYAIIKEIREEKPNARFTVLSKNPAETKKIYGVDAVNRFNVLKVRSALKNTSLFISGGGSLIQDATSTRSFMYYTKLLQMAKKLKLKTMVYANGIGPVNKAANKVKAKEALEGVDFITLRDEKSLEVLKQLGVDNKNVLVTADPAVGIQPSDEARRKEIFENEGIPEGDYFVVSVREWQGEKIASKIAEVSRYIIDKYNMNAVFVPMQNPEDCKISSECARLAGEGAYVINNKYGFKDIMAVAGKSSFVIAMRLHMLMYGANAAVPVMGVIYDPKVEAYLSYLGQSGVTCGTDADVQEFIKIADGILQNREETSKRLAERTKELRKLTCINAQKAASMMQTC